MNRSKSPKKPLNIKLYNRIKAETKRKFKVYPSAYANAYLVKEYKRRGGRYSGRKPSKSSSKRRTSRSTGLTKWFLEKWIDICTNKPCGRPSTNISNWKKTYPLCRPSKKINKSTPKTVSQLSKEEIRRKCLLKRKHPLKKLKKF
jgi:hypothetical protein